MPSTKSKIHRSIDRIKARKNLYEENVDPNIMVSRKLSLGGNKPFISNLKKKVPTLHFRANNFPIVRPRKDEKMECIGNLKSTERPLN